MGLEGWQQVEGKNVVWVMEKCFENKKDRRKSCAFDEKRHFSCPNALWSGTHKNSDVSTGLLARPFARSLAPLTGGKVND